MLLKIVAEIEQALEKDLYIAALSLAITVPDICGKAEFPKEQSSKKRYLQWYDAYIGQYEKAALTEADGIPYLSGEVVYSLRCCLLHQGTPNIDEACMKKDGNKIDHFELIVQLENEYRIYADSASVITDNSGSEWRRYRVNIRRLCLVICLSAKAYFERNKSRFNFFDYHILELNEGMD